MIADPMIKKIPLPCISCGKLSNNDWLYLAGISKDVCCGECKQRIGEKILTETYREIPKQLKKVKDRL